mmetsp:Transcript_5661/g.16061  ORF Transcript_5661/g.16061 Transcript_5661/m.16061 type:complete len:462 (-) Transcript_5661:33-1418(-)|eukprot:CAMPEP_0119121960 /NCGR_PEP_ID=MMETSP1310-20130426/2365_1 /TAXON_ID=464262 /ORGANISM="Genus nov. species nov., Strain RCC2339" /LENGTH=461 /DNA_ID=CAMNT_0007111561 /DNA_START=83 /DNA_END=1471 /DNA_ORIENTATION=+
MEHTRLVDEFNSEEAVRKEAVVTNEEVFQRSIPWGKLQETGIIDGQERELIEGFDKEVPMAQKRMLDEDGPMYAEAFMSLIAKVQMDAYLQYTLAQVDEILNLGEVNAALFVQLRQKDEQLPFQPLFALLRRQNPDLFIITKASKIIATLLLRAVRYGTEADEVARDARLLFKWIAGNLRDPDARPELTQALLQALRIALRNQSLRVTFDGLDGLDLLSSLLRSQYHQIIYQSLFCIWLLSYNTKLAEGRFHKTTVIEKIVDTVRNVQREKVVRISVASLRNLATAGRPNCLLMIEAGFMKILPNLLMRKWGDEELEGNLEVLHEKLSDVLHELGSWDIYRSEILSGDLEWSLAHKSDRFWRENVSHFAENEFQLIGVLINIVQNSNNGLVLAVALHDLGQFVRYHPAGRNVLGAIPGAKLAIMGRLQHSDPEVQKQALMCIQKIMVTNYELLATAPSSTQ